MRFAPGKSGVMRNYKSIFGALLALTLITSAALFTGCAASGRSPNGPSGSLLFNTSTNSIENKAYIVTRIAVAKVLQTHSNAVPKLQIAADDLLTLEKSPTITVD